MQCSLPLRKNVRTRADHPRALRAWRSLLGALDKDLIAEREVNSSELDTSRVELHITRNTTIKESNAEQVAQALLNNINRNLENMRPHMLSQT